jgi:hypothetical protein
MASCGARLLGEPRPVKQLIGMNLFNQRDGFPLSGIKVIQSQFVEHGRRDKYAIEQVRKQTRFRPSRSNRRQCLPEGSE